MIFLSTPFFELFTIIRFGLLIRCKYFLYSELFSNLNRLSIISSLTSLIEKCELIKSESFSYFDWGLKKPSCWPFSFSEFSSSDWSSWLWSESVSSTKTFLEPVFLWLDKFLLGAYFLLGFCYTEFSMNWYFFWGLAPFGSSPTFLLSTLKVGKLSSSELWLSFINLAPLSEPFLLF